MNKILVVDNQVRMTDLMSRLLSANGYETMTAESGHNALAKIEIFKPDLVVLDLELPDISGYDICKRLKQDPKTEYIMVLCTTSLETKDMSLRVVQVGADDFIEKNLDSTLLLTKIKSLLRVRNLSNQLKQKFAELEEKNSILEFQLQMGQQVQRSFMPNTDVTFSDARISSRYMPAMGIGGDFYKLVRLNDDCAGIIIGDVSGHGISAALLTSMFNSMVVNLAKRYFNPDQLLFQINSEFCKIFENSSNELYACAFYAVLDTRRHVINYSNAGQTLPLLVRDGEVIELDAVGVPIGIMETPGYEYKSISYESGDFLLMYTDGLSDTFYKKQPEEFFELLKHTLISVRALEAEEAADIILSEFYNFNPTASEKYGLDDVSIIICKL